jgi:hypothetical protein
VIIDKFLLNLIPKFGFEVKEFLSLKKYPQDIQELSLFLNAIRGKIVDNDFLASLFASILFNFITSIEVRDRQSTSRTFENVLAGLFNSQPADLDNRQNPEVTGEILAFDQLCNPKENWLISQDLSGNKREKSDFEYGNLSLSIKTLKGIAYDNHGNSYPRNFNYLGEQIINNSNKEINVGSFSFRALLKGVISDNELVRLRDRQGGLGSGPALRTNVFNLIQDKTDFLNRLKTFINYVYNDDFLVVFKSHYKMIINIFPNETFKQAIFLAYEFDEPNFQNIWYRWENNNLRLNYPSFLEKVRLHNLPFEEISFDLSKFNQNTLLSKLFLLIRTDIDNYLSSLKKDD